MNVGIVMFYDGRIKKYAQLAHFINLLYCKKYNLELVVSNKIDINRQVAWKKLQMIYNNIQNFDYIIWIDSDAFFYNDDNDDNDDNNIINIINDNIDKDIIFSKDIKNVNINSGILIIKNSDYSINFLKKWMDEEIYQKHRTSNVWEQAALLELYDNNILNIKDKSVRIDYGVLQEFTPDFSPSFSRKKPYILHLAGSGNNEGYRIKIIKEYIDEVLKSKYNIEELIIGSSKANSKEIITEKKYESSKKLFFIYRDPTYLWNEGYTYKFNDNKLLITRTSENSGWNQDLMAYVYDEI